MLKIMLAQSTKSTNDPARNIKMPFPPKSLQRMLGLLERAKYLGQRGVFKHSRLKLPAMMTISTTGTKMKHLQNYRKSTSLKTLLGKTYKAHTGYNPSCPVDRPDHVRKAWVRQRGHAADQAIWT